MVELAPEVRDLFAGPNYAHLATLMADGSPHSIAIWVGVEGDRLLICSGRSSLKIRNLERDPRVALSVVDGANPYRTAIVRGRVVEVRPDPDNTVMNALAHVYTGKPFPWQAPDRVAVLIEPERVAYRDLPFEHAPGA